MELKIKNKPAILVIALSTKWVWLALLGTIGLILSLLTYPQTIDNNTNALFLAKLIFLPLLYALFQITDYITYANKTIVTLKESGVELKSGNIFTDTGKVLTFTQLSSVTYSQTFLNKLLKTGHINFIETSGLVTGVWGFDIEEIKRFCEEFESRYKIKISSS